jgi:hypothetical protein
MAIMTWLSWIDVSKDFAAGEYTSAEQRRVFNRFIRSHNRPMGNLHSAMAMILGICVDDEGFCNESRFFFMQEVQKLGASPERLSAAGYHGANVYLSRVRLEEEIGDGRNCDGADCWTEAMIKLHNSWLGMDKLSAAVMLGFEGRPGVDFESRDLIIADLEGQLSDLEEQLANCEDGGVPDCSVLQERISQKNDHLRTIEAFSAQRTEQ